MTLTANGRPWAESMGGAVRLVSFKSAGRVHRTWTKAVETNSPWAFYIHQGWAVREANGTTWSSEYPVIALFWPEAFYQVFLLLKSSGTEYYCNLISPIEWHPECRELRFVDLDLDLYVDRDGPRRLDEDEFRLNLHAYPEDWIRGVTEAIGILEQMATSRMGPFSLDTDATWRSFVHTGNLRD
jgi:protein associated with RNAse G/E